MLKCTRLIALNDYVPLKELSDISGCCSGWISTLPNTCDTYKSGPLYIYVCIALPY